MQRCIINETRYDDCTQLFKFLKENSSLKGANIPFSFSKFIIDKKGDVHSYYNPEYLAADLDERFQQFYN